MNGLRHLAFKLVDECKGLLIQLVGGRCHILCILSDRLHLIMLCYDLLDVLLLGDLCLQGALLILHLALLIQHVEAESCCSDCAENSKDDERCIADGRLLF